MLKKKLAVEQQPPVDNSIAIGILVVLSLMALNAEVHLGIKGQVFVKIGSMQLMTGQTGHRLIGPRINNIVTNGMGYFVGTLMTAFTQRDRIGLQILTTIGTVRRMAFGTHQLTVRNKFISGLIGMVIKMTLHTQVLLSGNQQRLS